MKKFYQVFIVTVVSVFLLALVPYSGGSPGARTGSPGDGANCTRCHSGTAVAAEGWITSSIGEAGYVPGESYTITATGTHSGVGLFGFELTAEDASNAKKGAFSITDATETKLANNSTSVTQTSAGTAPTDDAKSWSFEWTAPAARTGDVTFYAAFNAANGNSGTSGDVIYTSSLSIVENTSTVGVEADEVLPKLAIYQDVDRNTLVLSIAGVSNQSVSIRIYDNAGRLMISEEGLYLSEKIFMDISSLKSDVYLVQVLGADESYSGKVMILK